MSGRQGEVFNVSDSLQNYYKFRNDNRHLQKKGKNMIINYTIIPCSMGYLLVATTEKGMCSVKLGDTPEIPTKS